MDPEKLRAYSSAAEICQALAHPARYAMVQALTERNCSGKELKKLTGLSMSNRSQHLRVLRRAGLVREVQEGRDKKYILVDQSVTEVLSAIIAVLEYRQSRIETLAKEAGL